MQLLKWYKVTEWQGDSGDLALFENIEKRRKLCLKNTAVLEEPGN